MPLQSSLNKEHKRRLIHALPKMSAILLVAVLALVVFSAMSVLAVRISDGELPKAEKGSLFVTDVNQLAAHSLPLNGKWWFYWQQLLSPEQAQSQLKNAELIETPHSWNRVEINSKAIPNHGVATYHVAIQNLIVGEQYGLLVPQIGTAYKLFINQQLVSSAGKVSQDKVLAEPQYDPKIVLFTSQSPTTHLTIQVSNHHLIWGGVWQSLRIAEPEVVYREQLISMIRSSVIIAILVTVAIFNLIHFTLRSKDPLPFIVAISCLLLGLREVEESQILSVADIWLLDWVTYVRLNFLTFYMSAPIIASYFHISYIKDFHKWVMNIIYGVSGLFSLLVLFTEPVWFSHTMTFYQIFAIVMMHYIVWRLIVVVIRKRQGAKLLLVGTICLFSLVLNDILFNLGVLNTGLLVGFGLVAFVICQSYLTYIRFINATEENVILYETLEKRNVELQEFSHSLEEQVQSRTDELQQANLKLEELANRDTLTGVANRRGILPYVKQSLKAYNNVETPFSLLVVDFDRFKQLNDTLGHEIGDVVLSVGANVMKQELRANDNIARWGGEEFVVLLPATTIEGAKVLAEKLRVAIKDRVTQEIKREVTATFGICQYRKGESFEQMFKRADEALYRGKEQGRDCVVEAQ